MTTRDALKAAVVTAVWTFLAVFAATLTGWLGDVAGWAADRQREGVVFPDPGVLVKGAAAAFSAALAGVGNFTHRYLQSRRLLGGEGPVYVRQGTTTVR